VPDAHDIHVREPRAVDSATVHERAVAAAEVDELESTLGLCAQLRVLARS
jgi:hypothetical protein